MIRIKGHSMRIIAGEFKGRVIDSPSEKTTRPTTDRVRESIFSSIYSRLPDLDDVQVLDAFAGSGALGIEALSHGALACIFVEHDKKAAKVLQDNLNKLALKAPRIQIIIANTFELAPHLHANQQQAFKLVLLDPPYAYDPSEISTLLQSLMQEQLLDDGCVVVYEHALENRQQVADEFESNRNFEISGQKKYGKIGVTYLIFRDSKE